MEITGRARHPIPQCDFKMIHQSATVIRTKTHVSSRLHYNTLKSACKWWSLNPLGGECCVSWHSDGVWSPLQLLREHRGMHLHTLAHTHTQTGLYLPVVGYQLMLPCRHALQGTRSPARSEVVCFPRQCVTGPSRCEDHMAEGGWSWRGTLMFFSWHELKWREFKDSICFLFDELRWWGWRRFYYFFSIREDAQLCKICHEPQTTCCITSFLSRLCFFCLFVFLHTNRSLRRRIKFRKCVIPQRQWFDTQSSSC